MDKLIAWTESKADLLRMLREDNGQSQGDVAHALAVWPNTVSRWELKRAAPERRYIRQLVSMYPALAA